MKYLMRAAQRVATTGSPKVRPAMPSRSPIAEADQRLNIDSFAAHFDVPVVPERTAPVVEEEQERTALRGSGRPVKRYPATEKQASLAVEPTIVLAEPVVPTVQLKPRTENAPARGKHGREAPARALAPSTTFAGPQQQLVPRDFEPPSFPEKATVLPDRPSRRANALPDPANVESRSPIPDRSRMEPVNAATQERALERESAADTLMDALNRAISWVERQARPSQDAKRAESPTDSSPVRSQPRLGEMVQVRPLRQALRDSRPITHLEIGKIEVEVVPPAKPAQNAASPRPSPKTTGFSGPSRPVFGWRQR